jgi:hypothetical protein
MNRISLLWSETGFDPGGGTFEMARWEPGGPSPVAAKRLEEMAGMMIKNRQGS